MSKPKDNKNTRDQREHPAHVEATASTGQSPGEFDSGSYWIRDNEATPHIEDFCLDMTFHDRLLTPLAVDAVQHCWPRLGAVSRLRAVSLLGHMQTVDAPGSAIAMAEEILALLPGVDR